MKDTNPNNIGDRIKGLLPASGNSKWYIIAIIISVAAVSGTIIVILTTGGGLNPPFAKDRFGIDKLNPTSKGGIEWTSSWDNGNSRTFVNSVDPVDDWFDTAHGDGTYTIDGKGTLTATGDTVRMYVHDPSLQREWSENLEITMYVKRISETQTVDYSGLQVFARTNHGTNGDENVNLCDDRGYGGLVNINGQWAFEKESAHHLDNGYTDVAIKKPPQQTSSVSTASADNDGSFPKNAWIGFKYVIRNMDEDSKVKLELYRDMTGGQNGGNWQKVTEFVDDGNDFGVGRGECRPSIDAQLPLIHSFINASSETKKPMLSVYVRHEFGTMEYSNFSIREIDSIVSSGGS